MKNKIVYLSILISFLLLIGLIIINRYISKKKLPDKDNPSQISPLLTPTGFFSQSSFNKLSVIATPKDGSSNIPLTKDISITFSQHLERAEFEFFIIPETNFTEKYINKTLTIKPSKPLESATMYTFSINFTNKNYRSFISSFTTTGDGIIKIPNDGAIGLKEYTDEVTINSKPDIYLANRTPFENDYFSIKNELQDANGGYFQFIVKLKGNQEESKNKFFEWLNSIQLYDLQISKLKIIYQN